MAIINASTAADGTQGNVFSGARWMDGSAVLPADLWAGCKGSFFLRVTLAGPALPRWIAPGETAGVVELADRRQARGLPFHASI